MARPTWSGSITFAGFPINVRAYSLVKSKSAQSFKTLCKCHGLPIVQQNTCSQSGEVVVETLKGVEVTKDSYSALPDSAVEAIKSAERSEALTVERFAPRASVPLHLATGHYRLVPDDKVPGAEGPVNILWNGLRKTDRAAITDWTPRAGSRDSLLAVHADDYGLTANTLPFATEFNDVPEWKPDPDENAAAMFEQFVATQYTLDDFAHGQYSSRYEERRAKAIEQALAGEVITAPSSAPDKPDVPDLMAAMAATLESAPAPKKKAAKKKAAAKA